MLLVAGCTWVAVAAGVLAATPAEEKSPARQARGIDLGSNAMTIFVARDKPTWEAVKRAAGSRHEFPGGVLQGESLDRLDGVDFQQEMIVAVFWGEMNFSGHDEKCWIEAVNVGDKEVTVDCRAILWGGQVYRSYRAWPYEAKRVRRSELPVTFMQSTEYKTKPNLSENGKPIATLKPGEWKWESIPPK